MGAFKYLIYYLKHFIQPHLSDKQKFGRRTQKFRPNLPVSYKLNRGPGTCAVALKSTLKKLTATIFKCHKYMVKGQKLLKDIGVSDSQFYATLRTPY